MSGVSSIRTSSRVVVARKFMHPSPVLLGKTLPIPKQYHPRQLGCPDLVPGLSLQGWWPREKFDWVLKLEEKAPIIREEVLKLRQSTGF